LTIAITNKVKIKLKLRPRAKRSQQENSENFLFCARERRSQTSTGLVGVREWKNGR
jgi:hypothetical protein